MKKNIIKSNRIIILSLFIILSVSSLFLYIKMDNLINDYAILLNENKELVDIIEEKVNYSQLMEEQMKSEQNHHKSEIKYYEQLSRTKDEIITSFYHEKKLDFNRDNPIDEFFDSQILMGDCTLAITHADYMYQGAWHNELVHAYSKLNEMAHSDVKDYINMSQTSVVDYSYSEGEIRRAAEASNAFGNETGDLSERVTYGTIARSIGAWETAEMLKSQTLKIHSYIIANGGTIDFIFDADETFEQGEAMSFR